MNKLAIFAVATMAAASLGTAGALAQSAGDFQRADGNNDGIVTPTEAMGMFPTLTPELFRQADSNHDGHIDEPEWGLLQAVMGNTGNGGSKDTPPAPVAPPPPPPPPVI